MFLSLIKVTGIGPKSALAILATSTPNEVKQAIENENDAYLTKFPGIGKKTARQIVLDLKGKVQITEENTDTLLIDYNEDDDSTDVLYEFEDSNGNYIWDPPEIFTDTYSNSQWDSASVFPNDSVLISGNLYQESENHINPIEYYPESVSIKLNNFTGVIEFILIKSTIE